MAANLRPPPLVFYALIAGFALVIWAIVGKPITTPWFELPALESIALRILIGGIGTELLVVFVPRHLRVDFPRAAALVVLLLTVAGSVLVPHLASRTAAPSTINVAEPELGELTQPGTFVYAGDDRKLLPRLVVRGSGVLARDVADVLRKELGEYRIVVDSDPIPERIDRDGRFIEVTYADGTLNTRAQRLRDLLDARFGQGSTRVGLRQDHVHTDSSFRVSIHEGRRKEA